MIEQVHIDAQVAAMKRQQEFIKRLFSIVTEEEKKTIPLEVSGILGGGWSPATTDQAIRLVKAQLGEDERYRKYLAEMWLKEWNAHPETHF